MNSWISSAFGSVSAASPALTRSSQPPSSSSSKTAKEPLAKRVIEHEENLRSFKLPHLPSRTQAKPSSSSSCGKASNNEQQSLADKYMPINRADLVVHKAKVDQLSSIIDDVMARKKGTILLIDGPTGCGKTVIDYTRLKLNQLVG